MHQRCTPIQSAVSTWLAYTVDDLDTDEGQRRANYRVLIRHRFLDLVSLAVEKDPQGQQFLTIQGTSAAGASPGEWPMYPRSTPIFRLVMASMTFQSVNHHLPGPVSRNSISIDTERARVSLRRHRDSVRNTTKGWMPPPSLVSLPSTEAKGTDPNSKRMRAAAWLLHT
jgi:hypothetical protein